MYQITKEDIKKANKKEWIPASEGTLKKGLETFEFVHSKKDKIIKLIFNEEVKEFIDFIYQMEKDLQKISRFNDTDSLVIILSGIIVNFDDGKNGLIKASFLRKLSKEDKVLHENFIKRLVQFLQDLK